MNTDPKIINLGVVRGNCPAKCIHCPVGETPASIRNEKFGYGYMDIEIFYSLCSQIKEFNSGDLPWLRIHGIGEPATWHSLGKALAFTQSNKIKTWVFTMGLGTNRETFLETFALADIVEFSINASSIEDFKCTKGLGNKEYDEIKLRMEKLASLKNRPKILVSRVQTKDKAKDDEFIEYWKSKNIFDDVFIRSFHDYGKRIEDKDNLLINSTVNYTKKSCLVPTARMNIDGVLGIAVRCFNELFDKPEVAKSKSIGSILESNSLKDIWYSETMNKWRENTFAYEQCSTCKACQPVNPNSSEKQLVQNKLIVRKEEFGYITFDKKTMQVKIFDAQPNGYVNHIDDQRFKYRLPTLSAPLKLFIELTNKCNLRCTFCSSNSGGRQNDCLSLSQIESLLSNAHDMGIFEIGLIGGEPLCYPHFFDVVEMIKNLYFSIHLNTNGFCNKETLYKLSQSGIEKINISIDGLKDCHEAIRGCNTFDKTIANTKYLLSEGNKVQINFTANKTNQADIEGMILLVEELGCPLKIAPMILIGRAQSMAETIISPDDWTAIYERISNYLQKVKPKNRIEIASGFITNSCEEVIDRYCFLYTDCGLRGSFLGVNCLGEVFNTGKQTEFDNQHKVGDIKINSLQDIWIATEKENNEYFNRCAKCKNKNLTDLYRKSFVFGGNSNDKVV